VEEVVGQVKTPAVAVVLAGQGKRNPPSSGVAKALINVGGKPMAAYVLEALRESALIGRVVYVGPTTPALEPLLDYAVPQGELVSGSVARGLETAMQRFPKAERILVITADLPWLGAEAVDDFVGRAPEAGLVYPIIAKEIAEARFPGQKRTYARLKEGTFTGGNAHLLKPEAVSRLVPLVERFYRVRKNPLAVAGLVGFGTVFKLALGRLSLAEAEARASRLAGVVVRAYRSPFASLGADVDNPSHLESIVLQLQLSVQAVVGGDIWP
jgi:GTP:adenosylcobinamide-phosphate guanylyltransferase